MTIYSTHAQHILCHTILKLAKILSPNCRILKIIKLLSEMLKNGKNINFALVHKCQICDSV